MNYELSSEQYDLLKKFSKLFNITTDEFALNSVKTCICSFYEDNETFNRLWINNDCEKTLNMDLSTILKGDIDAFADYYFIEPDEVITGLVGYILSYVEDSFKDYYYHNPDGNDIDAMKELIKINEPKDNKCWFDNFSKS